MQIRIIFFLFVLFLTNNLIAQEKNKAYLRFGGACGANVALSKMSGPFYTRANKSDEYIVYDSYHGSEASGVSVEGDDPKYNEDVNAHGGKAHLDKQLAALEKQFSNKDCDKEDCQMILNLAAHGYPTDTFSMESAGFKSSKFKKGKEKKISKNSHGICMADGKKLSITHFKPALERLKNKGVKIAVISEACFSGETADILGDYACVLTATGSHIPHTTAAHEGYGGALNKIKQKGSITMNDLAIKNLLETNTGRMLNVPIIRSPENDPILNQLNDASNAFTFKKQKVFVDALVKDAKNMDKDKFIAEMKTCVKLFKLKNGKPLETIEDEKWYKDLDPKDRELCFGDSSYYRNISTIRNNIKDLDDFDWDQFDPNELVGELTKCASSQGSLSSLIGDNFEELTQALVVEATGSIGGNADLIIPELEKRLKLDNSGKSLLSELAKQKGVSCKKIKELTGVTHENEVKDYKSHPLSILNCSDHQLKCCVDRCNYYIKDNVNKYDEYSMSISAACLNIIKATYLVSKQIQKEFLNSNSPEIVKFNEEFKKYNMGLNLTDLNFGYKINDETVFGPDPNFLNDKDVIDIANEKYITEKTFGKNGKAISDILGKDGQGPVNFIMEYKDKVNQLHSEYSQLDNKIKSGNFTKNDVKNLNNFKVKAQELDDIRLALDNYKANIKGALKKLLKIETEVDDNYIYNKKFKKLDPFQNKVVKYLYNFCHKGGIRGDLHSLSKGLEDFSIRIRERTDLREENSRDLLSEKQKESTKNTCDEVTVPNT